MNLTELRLLSLDFRRVSSNMLMPDADTATVQLRRFKSYIDSSPAIATIIQERIQGVEYDFKQCFLIEGSGWHYIEPPVDEVSHLKAQYDFMTFLCTENIDVKGIAHSFLHNKGNWTDIVRQFLDKSFKPLVDFVVDALSKRIMLLEGDKVMGNIYQNIGNNYGNVNAAGRDVTYSGNISDNDISEIKALIEKLLPTIQGIDLTEEEKESLTDDLETISEQLDSPKPKFPRLKKAMENIKGFVDDTSKGAVVATAWLTDWQELVTKLGELTGK
ncbi:hypothetical protein [Paenibacillus sp. DMB5]|uniref:hypothetical protein n=1 Tax=Paenibacillus sp. DMB5 TaxID=1780103 RepID=UPI00076C4BF2|nr:hypothetical protein [Paenibacillus sp. DMB5]KUP25777.1 hypothetical protein AWJ19_19325 [Paenibacillus sp. DMB5]